MYAEPSQLLRIKIVTLPMAMCALFLNVSVQSEL